jgi:hypothetical protein
VHWFLSHNASRAPRRRFVDASRRASLARHSSRAASCLVRISAHPRHQGDALGHRRPAYQPHRPPSTGPLWPPAAFMAPISRGWPKRVLRFVGQIERERKTGQVRIVFPFPIRSIRVGLCRSRRSPGEAVGRGESPRFPPPRSNRVCLNGSRWLCTSDPPTCRTWLCPRSRRRPLQSRDRVQSGIGYKSNASPIGRVGDPPRESSSSAAQPATSFDRCDAGSQPLEASGRVDHPLRTGGPNQYTRRDWTPDCG